MSKIKIIDKGVGNASIKVDGEEIKRVKGYEIKHSADSPLSVVLEILPSELEYDGGLDDGIKTGCKKLTKNNTCENVVLPIMDSETINCLAENLRQYSQRSLTESLTNDDKR